MLVKSQLPTAPEPVLSTANVGTSPCRRPRCKTCKVLSSSTKIDGPRSSWEVKGSFTCTTTDCIYAIRCKLCSQLYIGETKRRLADRMAEHLRSITLNLPGLPVATHFNLPNHTTAHFEACVLFSGFHSHEVRKEQEERLIHRIGCLHPNGMNVSFRSFPMNWLICHLYTCTSFVPAIFLLPFLFFSSFSLSLSSFLSFFLFSFFFSPLYPSLCALAVSTPSEWTFRSDPSPLTY